MKTKMKYLKTFEEAIGVGGPAGISGGGGVGVPEISFGPAYGRSRYPFAGSKQDTKLSHNRKRNKNSNNPLTDDIYTADDYNQLYQDYLKRGGKPLPGGYSQENLDKVLV